MPFSFIFIIENHLSALRIYFNNQIMILCFIYRYCNIIMIRGIFYTADSFGKIGCVFNNSIIFNILVLFVGARSNNS